MFTGPFFDLSRISTGDAGVEQTVRRMQKILREAVTDMRLVTFVQELTRSAGPVQDDRVLRLIIDFVRSRWTFRKDPVDVEVVKTPDRLLSEAASHGSMLGDCDDASMLLAAMCAAVGYQTRFVVIQRDSASRSYDHIFVEAWNGRQWLSLDGLARGRPPFFRPQGHREKSYLN